MAMRKWVRYLRPKVKSRKWAPVQSSVGPRTAWREGRSRRRGRSHHMTEQKGNSSSDPVWLSPSPSPLLQWTTVACNAYPAVQRYCRQLRAAANGIAAADTI